MNWAHHVIKLGYAWQMVIAAFDEALLVALHERRIPAYNYTGALPSTHFRHAPHLFHRMGYLKAECIRLILQTGRDVLVSDSDVVWVADPLVRTSPLQEQSRSFSAQSARGASLAALFSILVDTDAAHVPAPIACALRLEGGGCVHRCVH